MNETKPLGQLVSSLEFDRSQEEEFTRIAQRYHDHYQELLRRWYIFSDSRIHPRLSMADFAYIDQTSRHVQAELPEEDLHIELPLFAASELCRNLREIELAGKPMPHPDLAPIVRQPTEVVFYWGFDVKVRDHHLKVPILGQAPTGRFSFFMGSIRAIGVRRGPRGMQCVIYYRENEQRKPAANGTLLQKA